MDNNLSPYNWRSANDQVLYNYKLKTKSSLSKIIIPFAALQCNDMSCTTHMKDIDQFYYSIVNTVNGCIKQCIPLHRHSKRSIVGWNDEVKHYYGMSEFKYWKQNGMPRSGPIYREMSSARACFKYALRQCRLDELTISSTKLADSMDTHDIDSFWNYIRDRNKFKSTISNCIEGITGEADIAKFWRDHYGSLLNSSLNTTSKESVCDSFKNILFSDGMLVSVNEVLKLVDNLESNKSAGMDGLNGECMKNADVILSVLVSFCFNNNNNNNIFGLNTSI